MEKEDKDFLEDIKVKFILTGYLDKGMSADEIASRGVSLSEITEIISKWNRLSRFDRKRIIINDPFYGFTDYEPIDAQPLFHDHPLRQNDTDTSFDIRSKLDIPREFTERIIKEWRDLKKLYDSKKPIEGYNEKILNRHGGIKATILELLSDFDINKAVYKHARHNVIFTSRNKFLINVYRWDHETQIFIDEKGNPTFDLLYKPTKLYHHNYVEELIDSYITYANQMNYWGKYSVYTKKRQKKLRKKIQEIKNRAWLLKYEDTTLNRFIRIFAGDSMDWVARLKLFAIYGGVILFIFLLFYYSN